MVQNFIAAQLLNDVEWETFLAHPESSHVLNSCPSQWVNHLRDLLVEGMRKEKMEVEAIASSPVEPTFSNTIVALAESGEELSRATTVMYNLLSADTNDELDAMVNEMAPVLSDHENDVMQNHQLFLRVKAVHDEVNQNLTEEEQTLLKRIYDNFERSGATLDEENQKKFRAITSELSSATIRFSQNLLKATHKYFLHITDEEELSGIPQLYREAAAQEASERGVDGWAFTLQAPSFIPFMMYSDHRHYREEMYKAYHTRCVSDDENCNIEVVRTIVNLRRELVALLGYSTYAEYALKRRMAAEPQQVYTFLDEMLGYYIQTAKEDVEEVRKKAKSIEGEDFELQAWDFSYYSEKLKKELYDYDLDKLRPYFQLSNVVNGVFGLATKLYGITFERDLTIPVYNEDVQCYRVYDADHVYLALLYMDFFPRKGKQGGAWMTSYRDEHGKGNSQDKVTAANSLRPVVSVNVNFARPTATKPSLLTVSDVETLLHEFGHALHGIFAMTHYASLSGTSVLWDFVELPSQFMENFAMEPDFLKTFAFHYETHESLSEDEIEKIRRSRNFQVGYSCIRQLSFGLLDMAYYTLKEPFTGGVLDFEREAWKNVRLLPEVPGTCMSVQFGHIMSGGYAAGYYSYKWSEVLDADAFSVFKRNGIFDTVTASHFRETVLSKGGTCDPMDLYVQFRGHKPTLDAILIRDGLKS